MSNLERDPAELLCEYIEAALGTDKAGPVPVEVLLPRDVPLGGARAMPVRRTLPQRGRTTIGAWCFADHYGPDDVSATGGMVVPPHPHTGLQTASWLFEGEIEHRDSVGSHAMVRPGELNLMTAGRGISHSEVSTAATTTLHGVQLWIVLPNADRAVQPFFERHDARRLSRGDATLQVFVGSLADEAAGPDETAQPDAPAQRDSAVQPDAPRAAASAPHRSPTVFSPLLGAQIDLPALGSITLPLDPAFEHGLLIDAGPVMLVGEQESAPDAAGGSVSSLARSELGYFAPGRSSVTLRAGDAPVRLVLLGGTPFTEEIVMWWNFIGRTHDEIVQDRAEWQHDVIGHADAAGRFGTVDGYPGSALPAPTLPTVRLKPRS